MRNNILILGKNGQLGRALLSRLGYTGWGLGHDECDFLKPDFITDMESRIAGPISAAINAAAYTQVDKCEKEPEQAFRINAEATGQLAAWCKNRDIPLVHLSTDYVFDGSGDIPHREYDTTGPINIYGESKLAGEQVIAAQGGDYLIFRTSLLYHADGGGFFTGICKQLREKEIFSVVNDQIAAPTYVPHLAEALLAALEYAMRQPKFPSGIYHLCNEGESSRYGFAQAIFAHEKSLGHELKCKSIIPVPSSAYPTPARRPLNCRLDCAKARDVFGIAMPNWEDGLRECFTKL